MPKRGYERRNIHITHPIPQALLAREISDNWREVQGWLSRRHYSLDQIQIGPNYSRAIKGLNFEAHRAKKGYIEANADWLVRTDITRFYPSIYTHSITWAAYGKERVKERMKLYEGSFGDRLDILTRSCNRNQTIGIPIGPETSRILAEIISARIDCEFFERSEGLRSDRVDRLQDDWFVGVSTLEKAENVLSSVASAYREYGLDINGSKTAVERTTDPIEDSWIGEIGAFLSHRAGPIRGARLRELLTLTLRLQLKNPKEAVIGYTLSILESQPVSTQDSEVLESFLMRAAIAAPIALNRICQMIINLQHDTKRVSKERIRRRFTELAERSIDKGYIFESIWLIYTLRGLGVPLRSKRICDAIEQIPSASLALLLLDMQDRGLCPAKLPKQSWETNLSKDRVLTDWSWLLAYEGIRHGWLSDPHGLMAKPFFEPMITRGVVFYDRTRNVPRTRKLIKLRQTLRRSNKRAASKLLTTIRGFDFGDYG